jgi:hypothetical protein
VYSVFLEELKIACGGVGEKKADLNKLKVILTDYPELINENLTDSEWGPLMIASFWNLPNIVSFLLTCSNVDLNKGDKVHFLHCGEGFSLPSLI